LHLDHFGGMCDVEGKLVFPQARLAIAREEWGYWMREATDERRQVLHQTFDAYEQAGQIDLVEDGQEITPGIRAVMMAGHTPGHMGLRIKSSEDALLHIADSAHFPLQSQYLQCYTHYDIEPEQSMTTRREVFERAANERVLTLGFHFPFPGLGYVTRQENVFGWQPLG
jgi:glyoxylase-like metal-dependent hydrolase (beta-lactamase superfamily II)